eukprot:6186896-Pleurochrysis_carterae.AAC.4
MLAVVEAPHARRLVRRHGHQARPIGSDARRCHAVAVPVGRAHLRANGEGPRACAAVVRAKRSAKSTRRSKRREGKGQRHGKL